jgi:glycosyltransferase involved in cell wall biosynthesis
MRILYVYDGNWPRAAIRVEKQTRSLSRNGHDVTLLSRNELREPRRERHAWMTIVRLPTAPTRALNRAVNFPYFFNPFWIWGIWSTARTTSAECIVVADLPLALTAVWVGKALGIPVYYDMVEPYPEALRSNWTFDRLSGLDHLVRNPRIAELVERRVVRKADFVFVVSEESRQRAIRIGAIADRVVIVGNTPENTEQLAASYPVPAVLEPWSDRVLVIFTGILVGDRGLPTAIEAIKLLESVVPDVFFAIVGDGPERPRLERFIQELGVGNRVALLGWQKHADLPAFISNAQIGLLPFYDCEHIRITLANKLFDYAGAGLPVVASDVPPMRRILEEIGAGLLARPGSAEDLAEKIAQLARDPGLRMTFGRCGREAVRTRYNWSVDEKRFLAAISAIHSPHAIPGADSHDSSLNLNRSC